jgi:2-aminobenzoate-CoA ligase
MVIHSVPAVNLASVLVSEHLVAGKGSQIALIDHSGAWTYQAVHNRVQSLAGGLSARGVLPGDRVLLHLPNGIDLVSTWLATEWLGAIAVAVPPALHGDDFRAIVNDASPRVIVRGNDLDDLTEARNAPQSYPRDAPPQHPTQADAVAALTYTTRASGQAIGCCHSAEGILAAGRAYAKGVIGLTASDVVSGHPPIGLAYGLGALLVFPLQAGACVVLADGFDAQRLLADIERHRVTVFFGTATCYRLLLRIPDLTTRFDLRSLRVCVSAGEPLEREVSETWKERTGVDLLDGLGTSELFHVVISQRPGRVRHGSLGEAVPGYEARVVDAAMREVAIGGVGSLAVRGPTGCRYWNAPSGELDNLRDGWTLTGDLARRDVDGFFYFERRADDLIVSAGYNIAPVEVETVLARHAAVARVKVVATPDPTRGAVPKALVELRPSIEATPRLALELQEHVLRSLAGYKVPRQIEFVEGGPASISGPNFR